ncbi:PREDICTED: xyloglucan 6-xylosyltransferase 4-like [Camelina sativa]|uniref:Xyloglucan 6-xylosyltransferase 4-like n=1 Tax=Camelina sativa TaxID=90675 RepID=A0ABM0WW89_CAMSA|nr:PREDICTED: xyloglucan 6-xylosyltransferase 4-like [Camelina sativa]XP_010477061.1 PREDICTED: xyloglucan 6-xylosyltransferase 4-like [Camelina sativa]XP_010477062.1 PREDICTED: xyloglucan 6-xylosyltransferase 4-like [Camelina sativa]XP_019094217.1 PREDICTED: xyloglucan 6-xylosyltransferase 4-like [Camelina sativa]XP_019094218.1 PREDICTED: xyloglucan 6-xylosyltransferase 4-like [Camelina sativa]
MCHDESRSSASGGGLSTTAVSTGGGRSRGFLRGWQIHNTFFNIKIMILCGFVTILVLLATISIGNLGSSSNADSVKQSFIEEETIPMTILPEIPSDSNSTDLVAAEPPKAEIFTTPNATYTLGPKVTNWDSQRKVWLNQNPEFPSTVNGKARILLLTGSSPSPCDKPIGDYYLLKSVKNKIDYCRLHGIEIVYNMANLDEELSGYWTKLPMIRILMLSHPEVEWIWWMDSDALFTDILFEIPLSRYEKHNLVIHGYPDLLFNQKSWIALNTGVFLLRNCQWSLDLLDAWAPMGPKGPIRDEAGKVLTAYLKGRPAFEADDQSALIYLLLSQKDKWIDKVYVENQYYLHGFWEGLVDKYEEMVEKYHPGLGDERWPFVTHFVGCKPCGSYADYAVDRCFKSMERAFNFADNQVLKLYGFSHRGLLSPKVKRIRNETVSPLEAVDKFDIRRMHVETKP